MHYRILEHAANLVEDPLRSMIAHKINAFKKKYQVQGAKLP